MANSFGAEGPTTATAFWSPFSSRQTPFSASSSLPCQRPGEVSVSVTVEAAPEGLVAVTGGTLSARVRRSIITAPSSPVPRSASSSSSGSFISQCASRRSSSSCGPPPSKPRAQSQAWSEQHGDAALAHAVQHQQRPSSGPCITVSPRAALDVDHAEPAAPARRAVGAGGRGACSSRPAVTGWRWPTSVSVGRKPCSITSPVGAAGRTRASGVR